LGYSVRVDKFAIGLGPKFSGRFGAYEIFEVATLLVLLRDHEVLLRIALTLLNSLAHQVKVLVDRVNGCSVAALSFFDPFNASLKFLKLRLTCSLRGY